MIRRPPRSTLFPYTTALPIYTATHVPSGCQADFSRLPRRNHANPTTLDRKSTRLNSSHIPLSRMPSSFCNDTATTEIYTLSLHDRSSDLYSHTRAERLPGRLLSIAEKESRKSNNSRSEEHTSELQSHSFISYAVFFL